jgi:hypothetical protein
MVNETKVESENESRRRRLRNTRSRKKQSCVDTTRHESFARRSAAAADFQE